LLLSIDSAHHVPRADGSETFAWIRVIDPRANFVSELPA
jgi:hypothetical protein